MLDSPPKALNGPDCVLGKSLEPLLIAPLLPRLAQNSARQVPVAVAQYSEHLNSGAFRKLEQSLRIGEVKHARLGFDTMPVNILTNPAGP
ncbi:hypothetical protein D3C86_1207640 [compost metagenome]